MLRQVAGECACCSIGGINYDEVNKKTFNNYVDSNCIDCDVCRTTAPDNFEANEEEGFSFVFKQPENEEEEQACRDAMEECPTEAIGDDG